MTLYFYNTYETAATIAIIVIACISLISIGLLAHHRQSSTIKAHSFSFLAFSLFGAILVLLGLFSWPIDGVTVLCSVRPWAFTVPAYILLCPLLAKHYRIHRIFNLSSLSQTRRWGVNDHDVALIMAAMIAPQIIINIVWTIVAPLKSEIDENGLTDCSCDTQSQIFVWISIAYIGTLLTFAFYLTIRLRHLATEFNQSLDILSSLVFIIAAITVLVVLQFIGNFDSELLFAVRSFGLIGGIFIWECLIMIPKLRSISHEDHSVHRSSTLGGIKGPATLPLPAHALKQLHAHNQQQYAPMLATSTKFNKEKEKDLTNFHANININTAHLIEMQAMAQANKKSSNYPALSSLVTFISPTEEEAENISSEVNSKSQQNDHQNIPDEDVSNSVSHHLSPHSAPKSSSSSSSFSPDAHLSALLGVRSRSAMFDGGNLEEVKENLQTSVKNSSFVTPVRSKSNEERKTEIGQQITVTDTMVETFDQTTNHSAHNEILTLSLESSVANTSSATPESEERIQSNNQQSSNNSNSNIRHPISLIGAFPHSQPASRSGGDSASLNLSLTSRSSSLGQKQILAAASLVLPPRRPQSEQTPALLTLSLIHI